MSICNVLNRRTRTRCTRGRVHIERGMPHSDNNGNTWPLKAKVRNYAALSPLGEFRARIHDAVQVRMERIHDASDPENYHAHLIALAEEAAKAALYTINQLRRDDAQKPVELATFKLKFLNSVTK